MMGVHEVDVSAPVALDIREHVGVGRRGLPYDALRVIFPENLIFFLDRLRLFEFPILAELRHLVAQSAFKLHGLAVEYLAHPLDIFAIPLGTDERTARAAAFADVIVEAESVASPRDAFLIEGVAARPQRIRVADEVEYEFCRLDIAVGSVVFAVDAFLAGHEYAGIQFAGHDNPGIRLVVLEQHVVVRLIMLYHGVLQMESVFLGGHHDETQVDDVAHKQIGARRVMSAVEIA